ncbi:putative diguanylate cyclase YedQ [Hartmannibacter diazotrophicus]|uniref:diguanylate cyclase n=1 Tax=Hartmannibacter diazotrophicus TaxID=1482074 RepID=A0A2C9D7X2_9HYPH|nr:GGDEF domain-containing protein [Hartmannibacter diazotrophicus]SON56280.1 putative diguanylate cyclase YedQ [Hartmannibacter diazotrophicus]
MTLLHVPTMLFVLTALLLLYAGYFGLAWWMDRSRVYNAFLMAPMGVGAVAVALFALRGHISDLLSIVISNALVLLACGLLLTALRLFDGRRALALPLLAGALVWLVACSIPAFYGSLISRVAAMSLMMSIYMLAMAREVMRNHRQEPLHSRKPLAFVMIVHAIVFAIRIPLMWNHPLADKGGLLSTPWISAIVFELLLHWVAFALLLVSLSKERAEADLRKRAETDALTGLLDRRAFLEKLQSVFGNASATSSFVLFDLDHFKSINDRSGHLAGDRVLVAFSRILESHTPEGAILGRIGGEEFGCFFPGVDRDEAAEVADRVRLTLVETDILVGDKLLRPTVSSGVSDIEEAGASFEGLMLLADRRLYAAKSAGRNRVIWMDDPAPARDLEALAIATVRPVAV